MADERSFGEVFNQLGSFAKGLTNRQKLTLAIGAIVVAATLFVFVKMIRKPDYKILYSGMSASDAQSLASQLSSKGISYELSPDGTGISVPSDQLDKARVEVASAGSPKSGRMGFELFDKPNWAASDFSDKVNYQRALEGELERTIQTLDQVEAVRVHLVLPTESVFVEEKGEAKAAVTLKLRNGRYSQDLHRAIASLIASSVEKLQPENVTIIDADSNQAVNAQNAGSDGRGGDALERELAAKLVRTLEPVVGAEQVRASVRVEYDVTSGEEKQETYDPNSAVALTMQRTEETLGTSASAGVPGTASNVPGSQASQSAGAKSNDPKAQSSHSETGTYAVNRTFRHTVIPAGRLKRLTAALVVDDLVQKNGSSEIRRKRNVEEMKQIEDVARAAIGIDSGRGDVIVVQNLSFQTVVPEQPVAPNRSERVRVFVNTWSSVLRFGAIGLLFLAVYFLFIRPVKRQALQAFRDGRVLGAARAGATKTKTLPANMSGALPSEPDDTLELPPETQKTASLKRQLLEKVKAEPVSASRLVQSWVREGGGE